MDTIWFWILFSTGCWGAGWAIGWAIGWLLTTWTQGVKDD